MQQRLLKELRKKYPGTKFEFAFTLVDDKKKTQSLLVDGRKIKFSWFPPIDDTFCETMYGALLKRCVQGIRDLIWKKEVEGKTKK